MLLCRSTHGARGRGGQAIWWPRVEPPPVRLTNAPGPSRSRCFGRHLLRCLVFDIDFAGDGATYLEEGARPPRGLSLLPFHQAPSHHSRFNHSSTTHSPLSRLVPPSPLCEKESGRDVVDDEWLINLLWLRQRKDGPACLPSSFFFFFKCLIQ